MPERAGSAPAPEPVEPPLRAGTWQPRPRARHARPEAEPDDPLRLAPDELPWGIPARAAGHDGDELPPAAVLDTRWTPPPPLILAAAAVAVLVLLVVVLAVLSPL